MQIKVENLNKNFRIKKHKQNMISNFFNNDCTEIKAVNNISFSVNKGELVAILGPNGAGKSTTIKIMTGILTPSSGSVTVEGVIPYNDRKKNGKNIGVLFGQRSQLWWELPVIDSLHLLKEMYCINEKTFQNKMKEFNEYLGLNEFLNKSVRQLSLGQRVRSDIAASLLHNPKILFLDEPTIGLDILVKDKIRTYIKKINKEQKTTIILTSHDIDDVETICNRIIVIDYGKLIFDGSKNDLLEKYGRKKGVRITLNSHSNFKEILNLEYIKHSDLEITYYYDSCSTNTKDVINMLVNQYDVKEISLEDATVEDSIKIIYSQSKVAQ